MSATLMLLDTAGLYHRAFHALPKSMKAPDGTVVNALRGTLDMVSALHERFVPDRVIACWDEDWLPAWRAELVPGYKAHRIRVGTANTEEIPELLEVQEPLVREMLELLGIRVVGAVGAEADDVIATLAAKWTEGPVLVVTGDRDLLQLVDDARGVQVVYIGAGMAKLKVHDETSVRADHGVAPAEYVLAAALRGDPSDGLPGVKGVGARRAAELIAEHGTLDALLAAAADQGSALTPALRASLLTAADGLPAAVEVTRVRRDLEIELPGPTGGDASGFAEFSERWGLGKSAERAFAEFG